MLCMFTVNADDLQQPVAASTLALLHNAKACLCANLCSGTACRSLPLRKDLCPCMLQWHAANPKSLLRPLSTPVECIAAANAKIIL